MSTFHNLYFFKTKTRKEIFLEGEPFLRVRLNISEVSDEEYKNAFVCHALNSFGQITAHVTLRCKGEHVFISFSCIICSPCFYIVVLSRN